MLRLLLGFSSGNRTTEDPAEMLYCGHSATALNDAIAAAPDDLHLYQAMVVDLRKSRRPSSSAPTASAPAARSLEPSGSGEPAEDLSKLTIPELQARCDELDIDHSSFRKNAKADYIEAIETDAKLSPLTIAELKKIADDKGVVLSGVRRKRQILDALEQFEVEHDEQDKGEGGPTLD